MAHPAEAHLMLSPASRSDPSKEMEYDASSLFPAGTEKRHHTPDAAGGCPAGQSARSKCASVDSIQLAWMVKKIGG